MYNMRETARHNARVSVLHSVGENDAAAAAARIIQNDLHATVYDSSEKLTVLIYGAAADIYQLSY